MTGVTDPPTVIFTLLDAFIQIAILVMVVIRLVKIEVDANVGVAHAVAVCAVIVALVRWLQMIGSEFSGKAAVGG